MDQKPIFTTPDGSSYHLRINFQDAMRLRDEFDFNVQQIFGDDSVNAVRQLLDDPLRLPPILEYLTRKDREIDAEEFYDQLATMLEADDDSALTAFLVAVANSLPKLKRRGMMKLIATLSTQMETGAKAIEEKIENLSTTFEADLTRSLSQTPTRVDGPSES